MVGGEVVALTFDDGPDRRGTPAVLEALARAGARATFFVLGECVEREPELLERVIAEGHDVELHGHAHLRHPRIPREAAEADLATALEILDAHGVRPARWRLPWGDLAGYSPALAAAHGLTLTGWTADSHDWRGDDAHAMLAALMPQLEEDRAVVLMHDGVGTGARRADCAETARLVEPLVEAIRRRGLEPGPLSGQLPLGNPDFGYAAGVTSVAGITLSEALDAIAATAAARDAAPEFPHDAFSHLQQAQALSLPPTRAEEWALVRAVAKADGSVGRLFEGHLNAVERLVAEGIDPGDHWLGVWGAGPAPGEGEPARLEHGTITGVKVFCSGAGGLDRALVTTADGHLAYVDLTTNVEVDRTWYRAGGMRASESHRVVFHGTPVLALLQSLTREPYFSRDAIRTAAAWAGIADSAAATALADLEARGELDDLRAHAVGRILTAQATMDRWFEHAAARPAHEHLDDVSIQLRAAVADAGREIIDHAARATGSRPFATGTALDRARRDFELFVLQHRLDPLLTRLGRDATTR